MAKNLEIAVLLDLYGDMLTEKQRDFLGYYYNDDLSLQKMINEKHSIGLTAFGAPTERATSSATTEEAYLLADNYLYNPNWGWQDGKKRSAKVVNSFDPTAIINWIWKPKTGKSLKA